MQPRQELLAHKPQGATVSAWSCSALTFVSVKGYVFRFIRLKRTSDPGKRTPGQYGFLFSDFARSVRGPGLPVNAAWNPWTTLNREEEPVLPFAVHVTPGNAVKYASRG